MFDTDYNFADRMLHRLALGVPSLAELSFDLDQRASRAAATAPEVARRPHVFVAGLARSGTTILMRALHASGQFRSLTYRDMPFPLAPNLWKRLSRRWAIRSYERERAHGDGIKANADSPEALEEVFWRIETGQDYIQPQGLIRYRPDPATLSRFQHYVAAILASAERGQWRYLSKNNNNVLRLPALLDSFPNAWFLIPFRRPASQAASLARQHRHFCEIQRRVPFARSYMDWLVHHEFGLGHLPFLTGARFSDGLEPHQPDYWLETWLRVYAPLSALAEERCLFVCYEDLCLVPQLWDELSARLGVRSDHGTIFAAADRSPAHSFDPLLLAHADATYQSLLQKCRSSLDCQNRDVD